MFHFQQGKVMQSMFKKIFINDDRVFQLLEARSLPAKIQGMRRYTWTSDQFALLFKSPCVLHSFGMKETLQLVQISAELKAISPVTTFKPNSIAFCFSGSGWLAELNSLEKRTNKTLNSCESISEICASLKARKFFTVSFRSLRPFLWGTMLMLLCLMSSVVALAAEKPSQVKIQVGESKEVDLKEAPKNIDISHSDIIDVQRLGTTNRILITALRSGTSSLVVHFPDGRSRGWTFQVGSTASLPAALATLSSASLLRTARELQRRSGLEVTVDNGRIALFGIAQNEAQMHAILEICLEREECLPRYTITDAAGKALTAALKTHLNALGLVQIALELSLSGVIFSGHVSSDEQLQLLTKIAQSVCPRASFNVEIDKGSQTLVQSQLSFYRISQTGLTALGMATAAPPTALTEGAVAKVSTSELSAKLRGGPTLNLTLPELLLKAHAHKGVIQQIAQPSIVVASGGRGEILSGGELLFQSGGQHQKFFSQSYGISVVLQPRMISSSRIVQRIELKITHPQSDPTRNAISSLNSSILNTEVNSKVSEVLLLTRISQKANGKSTMKIPILGHLPILGELFKSREISGEDAELWITLKSDLLLPQAPNLEKELKSSEASTQAHWLD
jgi:pilus assembly protein CpaC